MREELRKYSDEAYEIVKHAANEIGPRLPGSDGEKKLHDYMAGRLDEIGVKPTTEKFVFAPHASIGGLPYAGWGGIIGALALVVMSIDYHLPFLLPLFPVRVLIELGSVPRKGA